MASFSLWFISFLCFLFGHGFLQLQACHHVYRAHTSYFVPHVYQQPYRTSYHFQPPRNWINGFFSFFLLTFLFFISFNFLLLGFIYPTKSLQLFSLTCDLDWNSLEIHRSKWLVPSLLCSFYHFRSITI